MTPFFLLKINLIMKKIVVSLVLLLSISCKKETETMAPQLQFKFKFNPDQERLNSIGQIAVVPIGHGAYAPEFNSMCVHYIELIEDEYTALGKGFIVYKGASTASTNSIYADAIDFDKSTVKPSDEVWLSVPLSAIPQKKYKYIRTSVAYQNYDVVYNINNIPNVGTLSNQKGTIASFVGYNTQINNLKVKSISTSVNASKIQGFWAFETQLAAPYTAYNKVSTGQAPQGATTVVNPLAGFNNNVPSGSCVVTGAIENNLDLTVTNTQNKTITLSYSTNKSFEWLDTNNNGQWDMTYPNNIEQVIDMGLRGLKAFVN